MLSVAIGMIGQRMLVGSVTRMLENSADVRDSTTPLSFSQDNSEIEWNDVSRCFWSAWDTFVIYMEKESKYL